jgi:hypothetical protein
LRPRFGLGVRAETSADCTQGLQQVLANSLKLS